MFAVVTTSSIAASSPIDQSPKPSPRSALRSTTAVAVMGGLLRPTAGSSPLSAPAARTSSRPASGGRHGLRPALSRPGARASPQTFVPGTTHARRDMSPHGDKTWRTGGRAAADVTDPRRSLTWYAPHSWNAPRRLAAAPRGQRDTAAPDSLGG